VTMSEVAISPSVVSVPHPFLGLSPEFILEAVLHKARQLVGRFQDRHEGILVHSLAVDVAAATTAAACTAPMVASLDQAIVQNANGTSTMWRSVRASMSLMTASPLAYIKTPQFKWLFLVYSSTYLAANATDSVSAR